VVSKVLIYKMYPYVFSIGFWVGGGVYHYIYLSPCLCITKAFSSAIISENFVVFLGMVAMPFRKTPQSIISKLSCCA